MPFAIPMGWGELADHSSNCYFYVIRPVGKRMPRKKKWAVEYTNIPSVLLPVPHGKELSIPVQNRILPSGPR